MRDFWSVSAGQLQHAEARAHGAPRLSREDLQNAGRVCPVRSRQIVGEPVGHHRQAAPARARHVAPPQGRHLLARTVTPRPLTAGRAGDARAAVHRVGPGDSDDVRGWRCQADALSGRPLLHPIGYLCEPRGSTGGLRADVNTPLGGGGRLRPASAKRRRVGRRSGPPQPSAAHGGGSAPTAPGRGPAAPGPGDHGREHRSDSAGVGGFCYAGAESLTAAGAAPVSLTARQPVSASAGTCAGNARSASVHPRPIQSHRHCDRKRSRDTAGL